LAAFRIFERKTGVVFGKFMTVVVRIVRIPPPQRMAQRDVPLNTCPARKAGFSA